MHAYEFMSFTALRATLQQEILQAGPVKTERWQGVAANTDTYEMQDVNVEVHLLGIHDLDHWRADIRPNLPWADDHFEERVGGKRLNPGEQWKKWPWGQSARQFTGKEELGPQFPPQDWAYLAGMIDGEGTIYVNRAKLPSFQGCVRVYQKDRTVLDYLHQNFRVGDVHYVDGGEKNLNGDAYHNESHQWAIGAMLEIKWLLSNCVPFLKVKRVHALRALEAIEISLTKNKSTGAPIKKVWGQDWPSRFNHTYADRLWPNRLDGGSEFVGHNHRYGNLQDLVELLAREPHTRQAWIPLFFPEDTGLSDGGRKVCTLGYQFLVRDNRISIWYPLRSCDLIRHWQDDCYLAIRLLKWVVDRCREINPDFWSKVELGYYRMHMTSLHIFASDRDALVKKIGQDSTLEKA